MNEMQLELTRLIGKKSPTIGCKFIMPSLYGEEEIKTITKDGSFVGMLCEIIGHPANLSDLHRFLNEKSQYWEHQTKFLRWSFSSDDYVKYDSSKDLLDQSPETLNQLISLIKSYQ